MKAIFHRRPTPATAIALMALFIALSGTAVALPGKNRVDKDDPKRGSIGSRAIANNSIRSSDIRNSNVLSSDIKNDAVTGRDILESSLGTVPSAGSANTANSAKTANTAGRAGSAGAVDQITPGGQSKLSEGQSRVILRRGPIIVTHGCSDGNNNDLGSSSFSFESSEGALPPGQEILLAYGATVTSFVVGEQLVLQAGESTQHFNYTISRPSGATFTGQLLSVGGNSASLNGAQCVANINAVE